MANVDELILEEKHGAKGVGSKLLEHLVAQAVQKDCRRIELDSSFHRKKLTGFMKHKVL